MHPITIRVVVRAPMDLAWDCFTLPEHVMKWNHASDDWHSPRGTNDLTPGGRFTFRMEAKDGSTGFDFEGTYEVVVPHQSIRYVMDDGRKVHITFEKVEDGVLVTETFDPEAENPVSMQQEGWQSILNNYRTYTEKQG